MIEQQPECGNCRVIYENKTEEPPCSKCRVDPFEENRDALRIFMTVINQLIFGPSGPLDINHLAIEAAIKREGINDPGCFDKVTVLGRWWIDKIREKHEN